MDENEVETVSKIRKNSVAGGVGEGGSRWNSIHRECIKGIVG